MDLAQRPYVVIIDYDPYRRLFKNCFALSVFYLHCVNVYRFLTVCKYLGLSGFS